MTRAIETSGVPNAGGERTLEAPRTSMPRSLPSSLSARSRGLLSTIRDRSVAADASNGAGASHAASHAGPRATSRGRSLRSSLANRSLRLLGPDGDAQPTRVAQAAVTPRTIDDDSGPLADIYALSGSRTNG